MEPENKVSDLLGKKKQYYREICKFCGTLGHTSKNSQYCKANINNKIIKINENLPETTLENEIKDSNLDIRFNNKFIWPKIRTHMDNYRLIFDFENKTDPNKFSKFTCTICSRVPIVNNTKVEQHKHGFEDFPSLFIRYHSHNELEKIFPQHNVQKETFRFFDAIDGCFINFKTIPNLMEDLIYKSVDINIDIRNLIEIIKSHVDSTDINNSVLTGGIFSKYPDTDPYFDNKYEIFQSLKNEADCDVYIQDENKTNFEKYLKKFRKDYPSRPFAINCTNYKFNNFKIRTSDGLLLNFIFPSNGNSILNLIENFDFAICQIFYSFALDTFYFPISLFKIFHNFINKFLLSDTQIRHDIEMDNSLYKNLEIYYKDLEYYKNMCTII
jgi:hypothetical protein